LGLAQLRAGKVKAMDVQQPCGTGEISLCDAPFALCAAAKCVVNNRAPGEEPDMATCNCTYMGSGASAVDNPIPQTNEPFPDICEYMKVLPETGYVLAAYSVAFTEAIVLYNWAASMEDTAAYNCQSYDTVTARCDGQVCQVMDATTWTAKTDSSTWAAGDPAVCTCPTAKGPNQTIAGIAVQGQCNPHLPECVPAIPSAAQSPYTYKVMAHW
jgi:hypothetical protein